MANYTFKNSQSDCVDQNRQHGLSSVCRYISAVTFDLCRLEEEEQAVGATYCAKIEDLLRSSDFVMVVVNLSPQTQKLIGAKELAVMKPTATLINISRG